MTISADATSFPKDKIKVVLLEGVHPDGVALFEAEGFRVETHKGSPPTAELAGLIADAHVVGIRSKTQLTEELVASARRLLCVGCFCIGTDQVALDTARRDGTPVFNAPFSNTRSVAELTIAETIMLKRRAFEKSVRMHRGVWDKSAQGAHEVRGQTLGIVGYGHIGSQVSVLAEAMGMRVIFYDVVPKLALGNAQAVASLDELLEQSDIVTLHVPSLPTTENLIGEAQLARMQPGAALINNARGKVVDLAALKAALESEHLSGAALDVFPSEPRSRDEPFESELCGIDSVILTPHIGGSTAEAQAAIGRDVATKLIDFVNNGSTVGAVNLPEVAPPVQPHRQNETAERVHRVLHMHRNVPGVLSQINAKLAEQRVNVRAQHLSTDADLGYVVLDVDPSESSTALAQLEQIPETVRCRVLW